MTPQENPEGRGAADAVPIEHNEAASRFEARFPEGVALLQYRFDAAGDFVLIHTEVPPSLRGRGLADRLARTALEYARDHRLVVVPLCPFVRAYLDRHPEFTPLVRGHS
ncbi:MAG TPA: GNAT family N-acetyltransferase [Vicinamibacterales bacterium]|nr:GNAT family N-acetyltransferase [Vicinamibacterales bacterium]